MTNNKQTSRRSGLVSSQNLPIARSYTMASQSPRLQTRSGRTIVRNHELIATIPNSTSYSGVKYGINPGLSTIFPWLASQAIKWEKYKWNKFSVHFVPSTAVSTTAGKITLAFDFNPYDAAPASLADMSAYEIQTNGAVYRDLSLYVPVGRMFDGVQTKRVRCGPVSGDYQLYDAGSVMVSTNSGANTNAIGELYIEYEIELISPQISPSSPIPPNVQYLTLASAQSFTSGVAATLDFDTAIVLGFPLNQTNGAITLPCGMFEIQGTLGVNDSANEDFAVTLAIEIDSAPTSPTTSYSVEYPASTDEYSVMPFNAVVISDGSAVLTAKVTMVGAAGTLLAVASSTRMFIRAL